MKNVKISPPLWYLAHFIHYSGVVIAFGSLNLFIMYITNLFKGNFGPHIDDKSD